MKRQSWYPSRIADQIPWHENFRTKLPTYTVTLGLEQARVDAAVAGSRYTVYVLSEWLAAARAFGPAATEAVDELLSGTGTDPITLPEFNAPVLPTGVVPVAPGVLERTFDLVVEIKNADAYTDTIGADLGVLGSVDSVQHATPELKLELLAGSVNQHVRLVFKKFGHLGVTMDSRRGNGGWEFLGIDTESPYVDERPLLVAGTPEIREYRARFWDKGTPNGDWTDVAKITVSP